MLALFLHIYNFFFCAFEQNSERPFWMSKDKSLLPHWSLSQLYEQDVDFRIGVDGALLRHSLVWETVRSFSGLFGASLQRALLHPPHLDSQHGHLSLWSEALHDNTALLRTAELPALTCYKMTQGFSAGVTALQGVEDLHIHGITTCRKIVGVVRDVETVWSRMVEAWPSVLVV